MLNGRGMTVETLPWLAGLESGIVKAMEEAGADLVVFEHFGPYQLPSWSKTGLAFPPLSV